MLGEFSGLAEIAARDRGLFPPPGPDLSERLRDVRAALLGALDPGIRAVAIQDAAFAWLGTATIP